MAGILCVSKALFNFTLPVSFCKAFCNLLMYVTLSAAEIGRLRSAGPLIAGVKNEKNNKKKIADEKTYIFIGCR